MSAQPSPFALPASADIAAGLRAWIECESPTHSPAGVAAMAELVQAAAQAAGLRTELKTLGDTTGPLLVVTNRAADDTRPGILILAHMDTVHPVGTLRETPYRIEGDKLYGPGCYDMKAGIYMALLAMGRLATPGSTRLPVDMVLVPDEETGSHASRPFIEAYARNARYGLVCEPARANGGKCVTARKGTGMLRLSVKDTPRTPASPTKKAAAPSAKWRTRCWHWKASPITRAASPSASAPSKAVRPPTRCPPCAAAWWISVCRTCPRPRTR